MACFSGSLRHCISYHTLVKVISTHWVRAGLRCTGFDRRCTFSRFFFLLGDVQGGKEVRQQAQDVNDSQFIRGVWLQRQTKECLTTTRYPLAAVCMEIFKRGRVREQKQIPYCYFRKTKWLLLGNFLTNFCLRLQKWPMKTLNIH